MDTRQLTRDIVVVRDNADRAVLVGGCRYVTAIDVLRRRGGAAELAEAGRRMAVGGLRFAILTREPEDGELPLQTLKGTRIVRADREAGGEGNWDVIPSDLLRVPEVPVHLVRVAKTLYDDAGRSFHCTPYPGDARSLSVMIEPEEVLVVADDMHPELPPLIGSGLVDDAICRFEAWRDSDPKVLVPASGTPIAGDQLRNVLECGIRYLRSLRDRVRADMAHARYPWERLIYTVECRQCWEVDATSRPMVQRHRANVRTIAEEVWNHAGDQEEPVMLPAAA